MGHHRTELVAAAGPGRPLDCLSGAGVGRASKAASPRLLHELVRGRGMVRSRTDISIFPVSSDWDLHRPGQVENRIWGNLTLIDLLSLPSLLVRGRNVTAQLQLGSSLLRAPHASARGVWTAGPAPVTSCGGSRPAPSDMEQKQTAPMCRAPLHSHSPTDPYATSPSFLVSLLQGWQFS